MSKFSLKVTPPVPFNVNFEILLVLNKEAGRVIGEELVNSIRELVFVASINPEVLDGAVLFDRVRLFAPTIKVPFVKVVVPEIVVASSKDQSPPTPLNTTLLDNVFPDVKMFFPDEVDTKFKLPVWLHVKPELKVKLPYTFKVFEPEIVAEDPVVVRSKQFASTFTVQVPFEFPSKITKSVDVGVWVL